MGGYSSDMEACSGATQVAWAPQACGALKNFQLILGSLCDISPVDRNDEGPNTLTLLYANRLLQCKASLPFLSVLNRMCTNMLHTAVTSHPSHMASRRMRLACHAHGAEMHFCSHRRFPWSP